MGLRGGHLELAVGPGRSKGRAALRPVGSWHLQGAPRETRDTPGRLRIENSEGCGPG